MSTRQQAENRRDEPPAVALGLLPARLRTRELLAARRFPWRHALSPWIERAYRGRTPTRALPRCRAHQLRYAC